MKAKVFRSFNGNFEKEGPGAPVSLETALNEWLTKDKPKFVGQPLQTQTSSQDGSKVKTTLTIFYE